MQFNHQETVYIRLCIKFNWQCCPHKETSQIVCCANQLIVFYMRATLAINGLNIICNEFRASVGIQIKMLLQTFH